MEIRQLRMFREVVDAGSISEAARRMNLSQPPLSYHMKMLEQELGVTLFHRGKKNIELTPAGRLLYERAETMLSLESAVSREVSKEGKKKNAAHRRDAFHIHSSESRSDEASSGG